MSKRLFPARNGEGFRWALAAAAIVAALPPSASAAERVVLGEEFTATW